MRGDLGVLRADVGDLRAGYEELRVEVRDLGHQMRVLHEDVIERIKAISDPTDWLRREMKAGDDVVRDEMLRRIEPLELTVRDHSAELSRLKKRRH